MASSGSDFSDVEANAEVDDGEGFVDLLCNLGNAGFCTREDMKFSREHSPGLYFIGDYVIGIFLSCSINLLHLCFTEKTAFVQFRKTMADCHQMNSLRNVD